MSGSPSEPKPKQYVDGRWRLQRKLAEGGGGSVWLALDIQQKPCAVKFLKWSPLKSEQKAAERFKSEFTILKSLSHPNIGKIDDFGRDPSSQQYYFTNELLQHGDLKSLAGENIELLENLLLQALRALEYLRNRQLLHLDIKPQNLMLRRLEPEPELALIDFGLATFRPPNKPGGTPNYMPPEVVARRFPDLPEVESATWPAPDHRSDLYSLGVTFYYLFSKTLPFEQYDSSGKVDSTATMLAHLTHQPADPSQHRADIPHYLDRIIMKLMARDPDERFPSAGVAAQALQFRSPFLRTSESPASLLAYLPKEGKLVGRKNEQVFLLHALEKLQQKIPAEYSVIFLLGKRGLGKTRLLQSIKSFAQAMELRVLSTTARQGNELDQIQGHEQDPDDDRNTLLLLDEAEHLLLPNSTSQARFFTKELCRRLQLQEKMNSSERKMLVIMACDKSWCEKPEVLLPEKLRSQSLELRTFNEDEVSEYLERTLGEPPSAEVVATLHRSTEGNPLFLTEILEHMIQQGKLFSLAGRPDANTLQTLQQHFRSFSAPPSYAEELKIILSQLPHKSLRLIELLSCYQDPCDTDLLQRVWHSTDLGEALLPLLEQQLVIRDLADGSIALSNPLTAPVVHQNIAKAEREKWHDAIAAQLAHEESSFDELLLQHQAQGSQHKIRRDACAELAKRALRVANYSEAKNWLEQYLHELKNAPWEDLLWCQLKLARCNDQLNLPQEAERALAQIANMPFPFEQAQQKAQTLVEELCGLMKLRRRELAAAELHFMRACELAPNLTLQIRMQNWVASLALHQNRTSEAAALFRQQRDIARRLPLAEQALINNNELGEALLNLGQIPEAIAALQQELSFANAHDDSKSAAHQHYLLGEAYSLQNAELAMQHYEAAFSLAHELQDHPLKVRIANGQAHAFVKKGDYQKAVNFYQQALQLSHHVESETVSVELMVNLGFALAKQNRYRDSIDTLEAALDFVDGPKGVDSALVQAKRPEIFITLGDALYQLGELKEAERYLLRAMNFDHFDRLDLTTQYNLYGTLCEIYLREKKKSHAQGILVTLKNMAKRLPETAGHIQLLEQQVAALKSAT